MSDISLAVGDGARRMTYAELAYARGISLASARRLARRHHWPRQAGNDGIVRVTVPLGHLRTILRPAPENSSATVEFIGPGTAQALSDGTGPGPAISSHGSGLGSVLGSVLGSGPGTDALSRAVDSLRDQLEIANRRIDELTEERRRLSSQQELERKYTDTERKRADTEHDRANQAERRLADKDATITGLVAEQQAMRQQVEILSEIVRARRGWWRRVFGR